MARSIAVHHVFKTAEGEARYMAAYDELLRGWPVAVEELDIPTRLGRTHVLVSGNDRQPALVLLPSMAGSATLWRPNVAALSRHFRVIAVDVIGQAGKSIATRKLTTRSEMAEWLADILDVLGLQRVSVIGSSYGGFLAMNQALLTPSRIDKVVLISPAGVFVGGLLWVFLKARLRRLLSGKKASSIADMLGEGVTLAAADEAWGKLMQITIEESTRPNLVAPAVFTARDFAGLQAPVLLLIGEKEILYKPEPALALAKKLIPGLQGTIIDGAHHLANLACPATVNQLLLQFLARQKPEEDYESPYSR